MVAAAGGLPVPACKKQVNTQPRASGALGRARGEIEPGGGRGCGGGGSWRGGGPFSGVNVGMSGSQA